MPFIDNDARIRDRAYEIWERAGRPIGLEHEHWAKARQEVEGEQVTSGAPGLVAAAAELTLQTTAPFEPVEAKRMRQALYAPEPFSFELFGTECPRVDLPIVLNSRDKRLDVTRVAA